MGHPTKRIWSWTWRLLLGALIVALLLPTLVPPFLDHVRNAPLIETGK